MILYAEKSLVGVAVGGQDLEHALGGVLLERLQLLVGDDVDQEVEDLRVVDARVDVAFLRREGRTCRVRRLDSSVKAQAR